MLALLYREMKPSLSPPAFVVSFIAAAGAAYLLFCVTLVGRIQLQMREFASVTVPS